MQKVKEILEKVLNGIDLGVDDYLYLQEHQKEAQETHNLKLITLSTTKLDNEPSYMFKKII